MTKAWIMDAISRRSKKYRDIHDALRREVKAGQPLRSEVLDKRQRKMARSQEFRTHGE